MRIPRLTLASATLVLLLPCSRAQDAVLVLSPSASTYVRAGTGVTGFSGDNALATAAQLAAPSAMAQDGQGNLYLADTRNNRIRRVDSNGTITTVAGTGTQGFAGDEGPATQAQLDGPSGIAVAADNTLFIADTHNHRIRHIDAAGIIHTVAGTGEGGFAGDGGAATAAQLSSPLGLAPGLTGDLYIVDSGNHRIRHIGANGAIATVAGDGTQGRSPDGTQATAAHLDTPAAVTVRPDGSVLIADRRNDRVLVLATDGSLSTLSTASVSLRRPSAVVSSASGDTLIADAGNFRVAQISSNGAGSALGSGEQGLLNSSAAPNQTPLGALVSVLAAPTGASAQFSAIDHDSSQVLQVALPQLTFPDTVVATASTSRSLLLRNAGSAPLSIAAIAFPSSFTTAATSSCATAPFTLAAGASCSLDLAFTPQTDGAVSQPLEVDAQNVPPQRVLLIGTALRTGTQLASTTSLQTSGGINYAGTPMTLTAAVLGGSTTAATGTVTFLDGTAQLGNGNLNASAQAVMTSSSFTAGTHTLTAKYNGDSRYLSSVSTSIAVTVVPSPDFTIEPASSNQVVVQSGSAGVLSLVLQPVSGVLNQTVTISTDGLPSGSAVTITPIPVTIVSSPVTVNVAFKLPVSLSAREHLRQTLACMFPLLLIVCRKQRRLVLLVVLIAVAPLFLQGCGGGYLSNSSVTAQSNNATYPVTVTATCPGVTGAALTHSTTYTLVVKQ